MTKKPNQDQIKQQELDAKFVEKKIKLLQAFMIEHEIGIQPIMDYTHLGIRPDVRIVKTNKSNAK